MAEALRLKTLYGKPFVSVDFGPMPPLAMISIGEWVDMNANFDEYSVERVNAMLYRMRGPARCGWLDVIPSGYHLIVLSNHGAFIFEREHNMLNWVDGTEKDYAAGKCIAGRVREYCPNLFREFVTGEIKDETKRAEILSDYYGHEQDAYRIITDNPEFQYCEIGERDFQRFTYAFEFVHSALLSLAKRVLYINSPKVFLDQTERVACKGKDWLYALIGQDKAILDANDCIAIAKCCIAHCDRQSLLQAMTVKLMENFPKRADSWKDSKPIWLTERLREELKEFEENESLQELADVANFAYFIWWHSANEKGI